MVVMKFRRFKIPVAVNIRCSFDTDSQSDPIYCLYYKYSYIDLMILKYSYLFLTSAACNTIVFEKYINNIGLIDINTHGACFGS